MSMISQKEIAAALNVSQALVSMVLSGRRHGISSSTVQRILTYAREHGYVSRLGSIQSAKSGETGMEHVGFILRSGLKISQMGPFFSQVLQGLHDSMARRQIRMVFLGSEDDLDFQSVEKHVRNDPSMRGLLVLGETKADFIAGFRSLKVPTVYVSARAPGFCHSIISNEVSAADLLVEHLIRQGHRRFAFLGCAFPRMRGQERQHAVLSALDRFGFPREKAMLLQRESASLKCGWEMTEELLEMPKTKRPTAWIAVGGTVARGAMDRLIMEPNQLWRQVGLVSMDHTEICTQQNPTITAAGPQPELIGSTAATLLLKERTSSKPITFQDMVVPATLTKGESTGRVLAIESE